MKNYSLGLLLNLIIMASAAFAAQPQGFDYEADFGAQAYPLGGTLTASGGYGLELWKDSSKESEPNFWQYGYVRPMAEAKTSVVTHRLLGGLEFYPISILGLSGGEGVNLRYYTGFKDFDCASLQCDQSLTFHFAQARLILGYEKLVGIFTARYDWFRAETTAKPFYEEMSYLVGRPGGDDLRTLNILALYRQSDAWGYGAMAIYQQFIYSQNNSSSVFAVGSYSEGPWRGTFGVGEYHSSHQGQKPSMIFNLQYTGKSGIALID